MKKLRVLVSILLILIISQTAVLAAPRIPVYKVGNVLFFFDKSSGTITSFAGDPTDLVIPLSLGGYAVVSIGPSAFYGSTTLRTLSIPDGISTISSQAFASCPNLESVEVGASVSYVGSRAFADCKKLSNIYFHGTMDNIESDAFDNTSLTINSSSEFVILGNSLLKYNGSSETVTVPQGIKSVAAGAFSYNTSIREVILPEGLQKIGDNAFVHSYYLEKITIPSTVSHIGAGAFDDTEWMKSQTAEYVTVNGILISYKGGDVHLEVPDGITAVGAGAFMANEKLRSVHLPRSIIYIDSMAFGGCRELRLLNIPDSVEWIDEYAFAGCFNLTLYGRQDSYSQKYAEYMEMPFSTEVYVSYNGEKVYFDTAVPIIYYERTFLPLRALMEMMGYTVTWDSATGIVTCVKNERIVTVSPSGEIYADGVLTSTDAAPININGSNLVSARILAEAAGAKVVWNDTERTVEISF